MIMAAMLEIFFMVIGLLLVVFVGVIVIQNVNYDYDIIQAFCIDREGHYNISKYNLTRYQDTDVVDCSDKLTFGIELETAI